MKLTFISQVNQTKDETKEGFIFLSII